MAVDVVQYVQRKLVLDGSTGMHGVEECIYFLHHTGDLNRDACVEVVVAVFESGLRLTRRR